MRQIKQIKLVSALALCCLCLIACGSHHGQSPMVYKASINPMADVQRALDKAKANNKNLLVVMGAQWCHDSRGLASRFASDELNNILKDNYELVYVDVNYYNDLRNISQRFSQAHYFATPTVMIINPLTEALVNHKSMHIWGAADSLSMQQYIDYFTKYAKATESPNWSLSAQHKSEIASFKLYHAQRLQSAYEKLVPGLKKEDQSREAKAEFLAHWKEVRTYRMKLQKDILALHESANANPKQSLVLPDYPDFSWD